MDLPDTIGALVRTQLDLHFGRLDPMSPPQPTSETLEDAATALVDHIAAYLLGRHTAASPETAVLRAVFTRNDALPKWLVNKGIIACDNHLTRLEEAIRATLGNAFFLRRFLDYVCGELSYHCWLWQADDKKRYWPLRRLAQLGNNTYCRELNDCEYVVKLNDGMLELLSPRDGDLYHWYIRSLGTLHLVDYATRPVYEHTAKLLATRYKTSFILDVFKDLFRRSLRANGLDHWGILILGDIPKTFSLADFLAEQGKSDPGAEGGGAIATRLLSQTLGRFDAPGACPGPEARFRLGLRPPQEIVDRAGALFWLRRTLDAVKVIQQRQSAPRRGLRVEERTFLVAAMRQKCIVYCNLFDEGLDAEINPCSIASIDEASLVLQSPTGNKLNDASPGQEIHGYFSIVDTRRKSTFCDFRTSVESITPGGDSHSLVELSLPAAFELTRRSHKRLRLDPDRLKAFSLHVPKPETNGGFDNLEHWPAPVCRLPAEAELCRVKDLSAGGLMLELHHGAPAFDLFESGARLETVFALLRLAGRANLPDLVLPLRLAVKRVRHFAPLRATYLGLQFVETGDLRNQRYVRWHPVGKDGVYAIADWIFRNTIAG